MVCVAIDLQHGLVTVSNVVHTRKDQNAGSKAGKSWKAFANNIKIQVETQGIEFGLLWI